MTTAASRVRHPGTIEFGASCSVLTLSAHRDLTHPLFGRHNVLVLVPGLPLCLTSGPFKWIKPENEQ